MADNPPSVWRAWFLATRPRTLPAAVAPVMVGTALAWRNHSFHALAALACLAFALLIQIGTNFANDYYDFIKGADNADRVGPRRAVASGWITPAVMKTAMWLVFGVAFVVGLSLLRFGGWPLLVIGITSILCGIAYTGGPYPLGYNGLGDLFVFVFFGLVAVGATYYVQAGELTGEVMIAATGVGLLAANILVVNNYRDVETDHAAGKRTLVVRWGRRAARWQFGLSHAGAFTGFIWVAGRLHASVLLSFILALVILVMAVRQCRDLAAADTPLRCIALLGRTGAWLALYAILFSGMIVSS